MSIVSARNKYKGHRDITFANNYYNILVLNIDSYTGGVQGIWENASDGFIKSMKHEGPQKVSSDDGKV